MVIQRVIVLNHRPQILHSHQDGLLPPNLGRLVGSLALYAVAIAMDHPHSLVQMLDSGQTSVVIMIPVQIIL